MIYVQDLHLHKSWIFKTFSDIISTGESTSDVGSQEKPAFEQQQDDDSVIPEYNGNPMNSDDEDGCKFR